MLLAAICAATVPSPSQAETPDYFVDWVQPSSANLYVDTGVRGKTGVKAELQFLYSRPSDQRWPVMLGSWGSKRFNLVMNDYDESRWEYGESMSNLGGLAYEGALCTADVEVSAAGLMSGTWTNSQGTRITPTKDAVAQQGVIDTGLNLYLFASNKNGSPSQGGKSRLYYCKLWQGDTGSWTLVRNLRPCVKNGVAGLYDSVEGVILYPSGNTLVAGPVAYDRIATWNGGATPTAAELGTAANWTCTDKSGASLQSALPDKATLVVFPAGIGSVTLPASYAAPWGAVKAEGSVAHPATQYGTCANGRVNVVVPAYGYTVRGEGNFSDLINARSDNSARKLDFGGKQMRHDGWFYVNAAQAGTWAMSIYVDDYYAFYIDDVQVLSYHSWQGGITGAATCEVSEGWHRFTSIIGDTGGGWGTATTFGNNKVPFTFVVNGTTYSLTDDVTFPKGSGTSTITLSADADWSALGKVALQGGARIDLNGHSLVVDDVVVDDYLGTCITNSAAKKSVLYFTGDPLESKAYAADIIKQLDEKIILAHDGDQIATWTGAVSGDPANANNWQDLAGEPVVPTAAYAVKISGNNVNLQAPSGTDVACKSFEVGNCTFTADCDWRGLSHTPTITGTANLNGHTFTLNHLSAAAGAAFSGGEGSFVEFVVDESAAIANLYEYTYIENIDNLSLSGSVKLLLRKADGGGTLTMTQLHLGNKHNVGMVQTNGTVNITSGANAVGESSGKTATYTMSGGSLTSAGEFKVGANGTGVFNQSGGTVTLNNWFSLGRHAGGNGTYTMTGGSLTANNTGTPLWIGAGDKSGNIGTGTLTIGGDATATFKGGIEIGRNYGARGYLTLNGGTLTVSRGDGFNVGRDGAGTLVQNGGTLTANEGGTGAGINNVWRIAWGVGHTGSYTLNDGTAIAKSNFYIGDGGTATYVQNGGTMTAENGVTLAVGNTAQTTFTLSGGVFNTKHIQKGSGSVSATFDGGTIVATNVTDGANFITGLNNVKYGPGGLTLDTAGYNVTMATASGANVLASDASTFTKAGNGTLSISAVPPVGNMVVSNGTLSLSASCDNASMLAHRWSFTSDLTDSVTGAAGTMSGSGATYEDGVVKLPGGNKGTCYIDLGANKLPSDSVTIEAWFTLRSQVDWTRVFVIGGSIVFNSRRADNGNACNFDSLNGTQIVNTSGKVLAKDTPYYVAITFTPDGNGGVIEKQYVKKVGDSGFIWNNTVTKANWSVTANAAQGYFWLGHSTGNDKDTNIDFDEVRVWSGALDDTAIALSVEKGADATAADIAEIAVATSAASSAVRALKIASGATLSLGAGNTLVQPVVSGGGMVSGGTLKVANELRVTDLNDCITVNGGTFDIDGAMVVFDDLTPLTSASKSYTLVRAVNGGTITGSPLQPDTDAPLPTGWHVKTTSGSVTLRKDGCAIFIR